MGLVLLALLLGGGGAAYGLVNMWIQLAALVVLAINGRAVAAFIKRGPKALVVLCLASLALPLVQLIPLPPAMWASLPGREFVVQSQAAAGGPGWFHWTVDAVRTIVAFAGLLAPFTIIAVGWGMSRRDLARVGWLIVGLGVIDLLLGTVQVTSGAGLPYPENPMPGVLFGTFANRNTTGILLDCAILLLAVLPVGVIPAAGKLPEGMVRIGAGLFLALGVILTQSRSSMALLVVVLVFAGLSRFAARRSASGQHSPMGGMAAIAVGIAALTVGTVGLGYGAGLFEGTRLETSLSRFHGSTPNPRKAIWADGAYVAKRYWPVGVGMGNFDDVFQIDESLETLKQRVAGRAHNDYLEITIEAGVFGLALVALWMVFLLLGAWKARHSSDRWMAWGGAAVLGAIAAQSTLDYPLRNQTMLCVAAIAVLMLLRMGRPARREGRPA